MNYHKCLAIVLVMVLSSIPIGNCSSITDQVKTSNFLTKNEMNSSIDPVDLQKTSNKIYVIITLPELVAAVHSLQIWKEYLGFSVEVVTIICIAIVRLFLEAKSFIVLVRIWFSLKNPNIYKITGPCNLPSS